MLGPSHKLGPTLAKPPDLLASYGASSSQSFKDSKKTHIPTLLANLVDHAQMELLHTVLYIAEVYHPTPFITFGSRSR
ncbi:hypothetical protein TGAM01_v207462 [Trichoderma gamsii]|uniref:Uncharacterized protein n=1 Tax=Trichoderma gamsii TaxID=398673 RepID=A0A2P4ZHR5_9HYPO|nr:hypothetical protein TGAM01_v207462 [Trichoderma gamsii]PON23815.1 hypothetical protein TGAM01_v207462 [Trichoderma gamsii]